MGRRKVPLSRIENPTARQTAFVKRRQGLFKKTHELSVLCDAQIGLIIFSTSGKLFHYCSEPSGMEHIIGRYQNSTETQNPENNDPQLEAMHGELRKMQKETLNLQWSLKRLTGEDLNSIKFEDLDELEQQLQCSVNMVRAKKFELLQQQMDNLQTKEKMLQEENDRMYHLIKEKQAAALMEHHQMGMVPNTEEHRHVLEQFPFSGEEQPSGVLQLAASLPSVSNSYHLLPAQPNLQDFICLHHHNRL